MGKNGINDSGTGSVVIKKNPGPEVPETISRSEQSLQTNLQVGLTEEKSHTTLSEQSEVRQEKDDTVVVGQRVEQTLEQKKNLDDRKKKIRDFEEHEETEKEMKTSLAIEEKLVKKVSEVPGSHQSQPAAGNVMLTDNLNTIYEWQVPGSNNCFAIAGAALYNQHLLHKNTQNPQFLNQYDVRGYKPRLVTKQQYKDERGLEMPDEQYDKERRLIESYAGLGKSEMGNVYALGDLFVTLDPSLCTNYMLFDISNITETKKTKLKSCFLKSIKSVLDQGEAVAVLAGNHYRTIVGIEGNTVKYLDSTHRPPSEVLPMSVDDIFTEGAEKIELTWLSEKKDPQEMKSGFSKLQYDDAAGKYVNPKYTYEEQISRDFVNTVSNNDIGHTKGVVAGKTSQEKIAAGIDAEVEEQVAQMIYVPVDDTQADPDYITNFRTDNDAQITALKDGAQLEYNRLAEEDRQEKEREEKEEIDKAKKKESDEKARALIEKKYAIGDGVKQLLGSYNNLVKSLRRNEEVSGALLLRSLRNSFSLFESIQKGEFELNKDNYALYLSTYQALHRFITDHLSGTKVYDDREYTEACRLRTVLDMVSNTVRAENDKNIAQRTETFHYSKKQAEAAKENVERLLEYYRQYCARIDRDNIASDEEKLRRKWDVLKCNERDIIVYIDNAEEEAAKKNKAVIKSAVFLKNEYRSIREQIELRDMLHNRGLTDYFKNELDDEISDYCHEEFGTRKKKDRTESSLNKDEGLTDDQISAISRIDTWVIRNISNGGALAMITDRADIASRLLSLPRRKRLFIYYLVESRERVQPTVAGFALSQTQYVPDLSKFKDKMIASKLKFYKRFTGGYIYWHKLTEAMAIADQADGVLETASTYLSQKQIRPVSEKKDDVIRAEDLRKTDEQLQKEKLEMLLSNLLEALALMKKNETTKDKKVKEVNNARLKALETEADMYASQLRELGRKIKEKEGKKQRLARVEEGFKDALVTVPGDIASVLSISMETSKTIVASDLNVYFESNAKEMIGCYSKGVGGIGAVTGLVGAVFTFLTLLRSGKSMTYFDITDNVMTMVGGLGKAVTSATGIASLMVDNTAVQTIIGPTVAAGIAGYNTVVAGVKVCSNIRDSKYRRKASELASGRLASLAEMKTGKKVQEKPETKEKTQPEVTAASQKKEASTEKKLTDEEIRREEKFLKGMLKIEEKFAAKQKRSTITAVGTAGISLTSAIIIALAGPTAGLSLGVGVVLMGIGIYNRFADKNKTHELRMQIFDSYFDTGKLYAKVERAYKQKHPRAVITPERKSMLIDQLRRRMSAELGFYSPDHAAKAVATKFAQFILTGAQTEGTNKDMYISFIKGLGLDYKYDKDKPDDNFPQVTDIVKKMTG